MRYSRYYLPHMSSSKEDETAVAAAEQLGSMSLWRIGGPNQVVFGVRRGKLTPSKSARGACAFGITTRIGESVAVGCISRVASASTRNLVNAEASSILALSWTSVLLRNWCEIARAPSTRRHKLCTTRDLITVNYWTRQSSSTSFGSLPILVFQELNTLGTFYHNGEMGLEKNEEESMKAYKEAAKGGHILAQHNLGAAKYANGEYVATMRHWRLSASGEYRNSMGALIDCFEEGLLQHRVLSETLQTFYRSS